MSRVLLIGKRDTDEALPLPDGEGLAPAEREALYQKLSKPEGAWYSAVRWCNSPSNLIEIVEDLARFGPIDVLDIVDHGAAGGMMMGQEILFLFEDGKLTKGEGTARCLANSLSQTAHVRLLGCRTACEAGARSGRSLVLAVAQLMGANRVVFGTIERVRSMKHFSQENGFLLEQNLLYSSLAAIDAYAPSATARVRVIDQNFTLFQTIDSGVRWACAGKRPLPDAANTARPSPSSMLQSILDRFVRLTQRKPTS